MRSKRASSAVVLIVGLALIGVYWTLAMLEVGRVDASTDIGGGVVVLAGYVLTAVGLISLLVDRVRTRDGQRGHGHHRG